MCSPMAARSPRAPPRRCAEIRLSSKLIWVSREHAPLRWRASVLAVETLRSGYGRIEAPAGVSIKVGAGENGALLGANGAGKSTLIRAISGVQPITAGRILFEGRSIERVAAHARVALGIAQVPEGRQLFAPLWVEDNLRLGAWTRNDPERDASLASVYELLPMLASLHHATAGTL